MGLKYDKSYIYTVSCGFVNCDREIPLNPSEYVTEEEWNSISLEEQIDVISEIGWDEYINYYVDTCVKYTKEDLV